MIIAIKIFFGQDCSAPSERWPETELLQQTEGAWQTDEQSKYLLMSMVIFHRDDAILKV